MQTHLIYDKMNEIWRHVAYEEELKPEVKALQEKLRDCKLLTKQKVGWKEIKRIMKMERSSYYRYVSLEQKIGIKGLTARSKRPKKLRESNIAKSAVDLIKKIRNENPTYGKAKFAVILKREHDIHISESSVGKVLKKLLEVRKILQSPSARSIKRKRVFRRWEYGKTNLNSQERWCRLTISVLVKTTLT
jgi:transposase